MIAAKVEGLEKIQRRFNAIPAAMRRDVARAMEKSAEELVQQMKRLAPKETGDLMRSIRWQWGGAGAGQFVIAQVQSTTYATMRITISAHGGMVRVKDPKGRDRQRSVAVIQEFGTRRMRPNPFFYVTWRLQKRRVKARLSRAGRKAINQL